MVSKANLFLLVMAVMIPSMASSLGGIRPTLSPTSYAHTSAAKAGIRIGVASELKGLGAFSTKPIKCGDFVGEYNGEVLTLHQIQARHWGKQEPNASDKEWAQSRLDRGEGITGNYVVEMNDGSFVDAEDSRESGWCRFMNHAREGTHECNIKAFDQIKIGGDKETYPQFYATRDIEEGEEISWDYGPKSWFKDDP